MELRDMWPFTRTPSGTSLNTFVGPDGRRFLSFISPHEAEALGGIPTEAIVGAFPHEANADSAESFQPNSTFIAFLHDTIRSWGPTDPGLCDRARDVGSGWIYVIDLRTPEGPLGNVPAEDYIGAFEVVDGLITSESYRAIPMYRGFTGTGMCQLPGPLTQAFVRRLPRAVHHKG